MFYYVYTSKWGWNTKRVLKTHFAFWVCLYCSSGSIGSWCVSYLPTVARIYRYVCRLLLLLVSIKLIIPSEYSDVTYFMLIVRGLTWCTRNIKQLVVNGPRWTFGHKKIIGFSDASIRYAHISRSQWFFSPKT